MAVDIARNLNYIITSDPWFIMIELYIFYLFILELIKLNDESYIYYRYIITYISLGI